MTVDRHRHPRTLVAGQGDERTVTVGVRDGQRAAVEFAADEARSLGCDLMIVHAFTVPPAPPERIAAFYGVDVVESFRDTGQAVVDQAALLLASGKGDAPVQRVVREGRAGTVLTDLAATSCLMVLGPDDAVPWWSRLFHSRVARALVGAAGCPVVVVPDSWDRRRQSRDVTLLLDVCAVSHGPLRFAFDVASRHHGLLHVVHVDDADAIEGDGVPWHDMTRLIDAWRARYPEVWADVRVVTGPADLAAIGAIGSTGLLVMGRSDAPHLASGLHGSLARSVIEHADCPVAVVPPDYDG